MHDIWELDNEPVTTFGTEEEPYLHSLSLAPMPTEEETNFWTLALIILGIWLAVRNL